jgi:hypothetical protein
MGIVRKVLDKVGTVVIGQVLRDLWIAGSIAALFYGLSQWSRPLAWVSGGALGVVLWSLPYWRRKVSP